MPMLLLHGALSAGPEPSGQRGADAGCRVAHRIDLYGGQYTIEGSLEMCKAKCVGICEFIVYNSLQQCYQKRSW